MKLIRPVRTAAALVAVAAIIGAGCGDDDDDATDGATDDVDQVAGNVNGDAETIEVRASDYTFEDLPDTVSVGTRLTLVNDSEGELHELVAIRLPDDEDRSVEELLEAPEEDEEDEDPPAMVLIAPPGEEAEAVLGDGTLTEPGRYAIICAIPTGADPDEFLAAAAESEEGPPDVEGGPPHFVHGMFAELTVE
jgi:uncharacterized cupredoxin-like copper-binding protein